MHHRSRVERTRSRQNSAKRSSGNRKPVRKEAMKTGTPVPTDAEEVQQNSKADVLGHMFQYLKLRWKRIFRLKKRMRRSNSGLECNVMDTLIQKPICLLNTVFKDDYKHPNCYHIFLLFILIHLNSLKLHCLRMIVPYYETCC
ncbi:hypothetical protein LXL04_019006 [Taraxacum kok-saghyz]